jgi:hypothetical protein
MAGTLNEFYGNIGGGLITAILLYFSSGVLAFLLLLVFLTRHVAIYVLMPLMPVLIPLWIIDEGPMKYIAEVAESIGGMFVPFVFMTVPTAGILLVGYSIQDALRQSLGSIAVLPGISGTATSAYAIILFVFWVMALVAPLFVLFGGRAGLPLAYLTAGYLAGRGMRGVARRGAGRLKPSRAGGTMSSSGSAAASSASTRGRQVGEHLPVAGQQTALTPRVRETGGGVGEGTVSPGEVSGPLAGVPDWRKTAVGEESKGGAGGGRTGPRSTARPWDGVRGGIDNERVQSRITPESGFGEQLPDDRRFTFGHSRGGEFQQISHQTRLTKSDVMNRKYPRFANSALYKNKSDMYLRDDQGQLYDVTPQWDYDQQHTRFDEEAREVVYQAQDYGAGSAAGRENHQRRN